MEAERFIHSMMNFEQITTLENEHTSGSYSKRPLDLVRGSGVEVFDSYGKRYLDMTSGQGVALLGHAHPRVAEAIATQAHTLITCPEIFTMTAVRSYTPS
jgi:acetylornithine/succinyldiaminopimelate/putrescine aminotransferase